MTADKENDMRTNATFTNHGAGARKVALAALAAFSTACASGGGAPPVIGPEAEAAFAALAGDWVLNESISTAQIEMPPVTTSSAGASPFQAAARQRAAFMVFMDRPAGLTLRVDAEAMAYVPSTGESIEVPKSGRAVSRQVNRQIIRTRVFWEEGRLGLQHDIDVWRVRETLDLVNGRLEVTRTIRITGETWPPIVLRYDRDEGK